MKSHIFHAVVCFSVSVINYHDRNQLGEEKIYLVYFHDIFMLYYIMREVSEGSVFELFYGVFLEFRLAFFSVDRKAEKNVRGRGLRGKMCFELLSFGHGVFIAYTNV